MRKIDISKWTKRQKLIALVAALVILVGIGFLIKNLSDKNDGSIGNLPPVNIGGAEVIIKGKFACLPYKAPIPSDPKCILGIESDTGLIYGMDTSSATATGLGSDVTPEDTILTSGIFVPLDQVPGEEWKKFSIEGVIRVERIFTPTTEEPEPPFTGPLQNG